jgi:hypothetical protein
MDTLELGAAPQDGNAFEPSIAGLQDPAASLLFAGGSFNLFRYAYANIIPCNSSILAG